MATASDDVHDVLWRGESSPKNELVRVLGDLLPRLTSTAVGLALFLLVTGLWGAVAVWWVGGFFVVVALFETARAWDHRPPANERYTLTERHLIVDSDGDRTAVDLRKLGELTLTAHRDGTGDIVVRPVTEPLPPSVERFVAGAERLGVPRRRQSVTLLAHDVPDAGDLLHRIESARRGLPMDDPDDDRTPPAPTGFQRPSLWAALLFVVFGMLPILAVTSGVARAGSELLALVLGALFVGLGVGMVWLWWSKRPAG
jgi:nitrate reductase NapE component